jgi:hypothetical protein
MNFVYKRENILPQCLLPESIYIVAVSPCLILAVYSLLYITAGNITVSNDPLISKKVHSLVFICHEQIATIAKDNQLNVLKIFFVTYTLIRLFP